VAAQNHLGLSTSLKYFPKFEKVLSRSHRTAINKTSFESTWLLVFGLHPDVYEALRKTELLKTFGIRHSGFRDYTGTLGGALDNRTEQRPTNTIGSRIDLG
jgi:hypothetical protein